MNIKKLKKNFRVQNRFKMIEILGTLLLIGIVLFVFYRLVILPMAKENDLKNQYQSAAEPRLILQVGETDNEFWAHVTRERQRFIQSGNNWALKQVPVIAIPYDSVVTIKWFDKEYNYSTVGMGYREYTRQSMIIYDQLYTIWQSKVFGKFGEKVVYEARGQDPFDPNNLWGERPVN